MLLLSPETLHSCFYYDQSGCDMLMQYMHITACFDSHWTTIREVFHSSLDEDEPEILKGLTYVQNTSQFIVGSHLFTSIVLLQTRIFEL